MDRSVALALKSRHDLKFRWDCTHWYALLYRNLPMVKLARSFTCGKLCVLCLLQLLTDSSRCPNPPLCHTFAHDHTPASVCLVLCAVCCCSC
jgi:hypothetical protein